MPAFLTQLRQLGISGVQNFPTVGLIDGVFRENLEATGMGYDKEVATIKTAHELGFFTSPYVFDAQQAAAMAEAGADMLVAHVGLTTSGDIGAAVALSLDDAVERVLAIAAGGRQVRSDILVICHGGPFDEPEAVSTGLGRLPGVQGFFGASTIERLPTERAIPHRSRHSRGFGCMPRRRLIRTRLVRLGPTVAASNEHGRDLRYLEALWCLGRRQPGPRKPEPLQAVSHNRAWLTRRLEA